MGIDQKNGVLYVDQLGSVIVLYTFLLNEYAPLAAYAER